MKIGLFNVNAGACADPAVAVRMAQQAEELGYESLWAGEHVVAPSPRVPPSPIEPTDPMVDPLVCLAHLGAVTRTVKLGTGIIILPQRNPVVLAKQVASLDVVTGGRLVFGIGVGYLEPEMSAIGVPMADRGRRSDEYLEAMQALWTMDAPAYDGTYVSFSGVDAHPRPVQPGGPPIVVGGRTPAAYRRAVQRGHGWYGFALDVDQTIESIEGLRAAAGAVDRPAGLGELEITVTPRVPVDAEAVARFADAGVHRLVLLTPVAKGEDAVRAYVDRHAPSGLGAEG